MQQAKLTHLPRQIRLKGSYEYGSKQETNRLRGMATLLLLVVLGGMIFFFVKDMALNTSSEEPAAAALPATTTATVTPTNTSRPTTTAMPSATPRPTRTPTMTLPATFTSVPHPTASYTPTPSPSSTPGDIVVLARTNAPGVNVRTGPHLSYPVAWLMDTEGSELTITGQTSAGDWFQVCCLNGQGGWLAAETVDVEGDLTLITVIPIPKPHVAILPIRLNVRSGPGVIYPILEIAEQGTEYEIITNYQDGLWWEVCCIDGRRGWVIGESVAIYGDVSNIPASVIIPPTPTFTPEPVVPTATQEIPN